MKGCVYLYAGEFRISVLGFLDGSHPKNVPKPAV